MIHWHAPIVAVANYIFLVGCEASSGSVGASPSPSVLHINTSKALGKVDARYVSYTLDWWPPNQGCQPPEGWGPNANVLEVDLDSPKLRLLLAALGPSILRIGGSLDKVVEYEIPSEGVLCSSQNHTDIFTKDRQEKPCLTAARWDALHEFAEATNAKIVFGLSYPEQNSQQPGLWNASQAIALLRYSYQQNYSRETTFYGVELGEELTQYKLNTNAFDNYVAAYHECARLLHSLWDGQNDTSGREAPTILNGDSRYPLLMGPCPGMMWPQLATWFPAFLNRTSDVLDVAVYHSYNQIVPGQLYLNMTIPSGNLSTQHGVSPGDTGWQAVAMRDFVTNKNGNKHQQLWLGEFGPHRCGGGPGNISSTFASSFGYMDTLGTLARLGHSVLARQTLVGGKYELLRCSTGDDRSTTDDGFSNRGCDFEPLPDYWVALLWRKLMGPIVLEAPVVISHHHNESLADIHNLGNEYNDWREFMRFHAHCTQGQTNGSLTIAFSNVHPSKSFSFQVPAYLGKTIISFELQSHPTPAGFDADELQLNGSVLHVGNSTWMPPLIGKTIINEPFFAIGPIAMGFLTFPEANAQVCQNMLPDLSPPWSPESPLLRTFL